MVDYRGSTVEDLQLSPALVLGSDTPVGTAVQMAFERDFTILPISDPSTRQLLGWINASSLEESLKSGSVEFDAPISALEGGAKGAVGGLSRFNRSKGYTLIVPDTPLEALEEFFERGKAQGVGFALVTDQARKFVLGVVTPEDLDKFVTRRNLK